MRAFFYSFGCKVNQYETQNIKQNFVSAGYELSDSFLNSDVCVINTCTVTSMSDRKNRQLIHKIKKDNPDCVLVITGCFPQAFENEAISISEADIITGASDKNVIHKLVEEFLTERKKIIKISKHTKFEKFESMKNTSYPDKTRAYVKIQDGCNQYCSYCIIPVARGTVRSKPLDELEAELNTLSESGHTEIVLVGINLSCYGMDTGQKLIDAIKAAENTNGISRIRLGSLEPELITDDDIKAMASFKKLCPHFHLSLQSGCDKTLKSMNRKYTTSEYYELITKLRAAFDNCAITTDIMVGFPGESDEDFKQSLEFVEKCGFANTHVFPYSKRNGTKAAERADQISPEIKEKRASVMTETTKISKRDFLKTQVGLEVPVLFERNISNGFFKGYSPNYTLTKINVENCGIDLRKKIFCVKILECKNDYCIGEIVN